MGKKKRVRPEVIENLYNDTACRLDDEGFAVIFTNKIGVAAYHTRWEHENTGRLVDVWFSRNGITVWRVGTTTSHVCSEPKEAVKVVLREVGF